MSESPAAQLGNQIAAIEGKQREMLEQQSQDGDRIDSLNEGLEEVKRLLDTGVPNPPEPSPGPEPAPEPPPVPPEPVDAPFGMNLYKPVVGWDYIREKARPPEPDNIAEVISVHDPYLTGKLERHKPGSWLVVRGDAPFPLGAFQYAGWVKLEVPAIYPRWRQHSIRGTGDTTDRLWIENTQIISRWRNNWPIAETLFQNLDYLYADRVQFVGLNFAVMDYGTFARFKGAVINSEFVDHISDPIHQFTGDVVNVNIASVANVKTPDGKEPHSDLAQWTNPQVRDLYWKHVTVQPGNDIMGLRGYKVLDSHFEDIHHSSIGAGHPSVDFRDA